MTAIADIPAPSDQVSVIDVAGALDPAAEAAILASLEPFRRETTMHIAVVVVDALDRPAEDFARELNAQWAASFSYQSLVVAVATNGDVSIGCGDLQLARRRKQRGACEEVRAMFEIDPRDPAPGLVEGFSEMDDVRRDRLHRRASVRCRGGPASAWSAPACLWWRGCWSSERNGDFGCDLVVHAARGSFSTEAGGVRLPVRRWGRPPATSAFGWKRGISLRGRSRRLVDEPLARGTDCGVGGHGEETRRE